MSLDDRVESLVKGLEMVTSFANRVLHLEPKTSEQYLRAVQYKRDLNHSIRAQSIGTHLRDDYVYLGECVAGEAKSESHGMLGLLMLSMTGCFVMGVHLRSPVVMVASGVSGGAMYVLGKYADRKEQRRFRKEIKSTRELPEECWMSAFVTLRGRYGRV